MRAYQEGAGLDSMGTAESAFLPLDALQFGAPGGVRCSFGTHVARGKYCVWKGIHSSGAAIAWAARLLDLGGTGAASYDRMQSAAAQAPPGSCGVFFLPRLAPIDRGAFIGLTASAGSAEMARAVYEGLAYEWRSYLEAIEQVTGTDDYTQWHGHAVALSPGKTRTNQDTIVVSAPPLPKSDSENEP